MAIDYDDSNWREEYKAYTSSRYQLDLLENGPKSLSQSWMMGAMHNKWKKIKGYKDSSTILSGRAYKNETFSDFLTAKLLGIISPKINNSPVPTMVAAATARGPSFNHLTAKAVTTAVKATFTKLLPNKIVESNLSVFATML